MTTRFGFLRRVWALALCAWVMMVMGGQGAWAAPGDCVKAAEIVDAMFSTGAGAGRNGIPSDYKPPCRLPAGRIIAIQATESGPNGGAGTTSAGGAKGCGQLIGKSNPNFKIGSKTLRYDLEGNNIHNLLRGAEYLCYLQDYLNLYLGPSQDRCDLVAAAYNAGEGVVQGGIRLTKARGKPLTIENVLAAGVPLYPKLYPKPQVKIQEALGHAGCTCGGDLQKKYAAGRFCSSKGGGIASAIADAVLALDKINDVGTGVIQALAKVIETAVVLFDDHLGPGLLSVVMVIYSIMALWAIAKLLMPFGPPGNAGQTMNGLLTLTGTVGIVALMLSNLSLLTSLVFFPIMSLMTELGDLSTGSFQSTATISSECKTAQGQSLSGDAAEDAKLLATRMTCTVDQAMQPLKQTLRISMASLKRLEGDFNDTGIDTMKDSLNQSTSIFSRASGAVLTDIDNKRKQAMQIMVFISAVPLAVMSATAILGIIATTAQAFWKIAFEFFKLAPAVAAFAFRPTRGVFATSVKGWISPIMIFAVTYSMLGLSSNVVCNMEVAQTPSGPVTLCNDSEGYVQGIAEAPYNLQAEFREQKEGEAVFPMITKSIWISLAFFTLFINSSLRLAAKMDWVGGGGLADGLQKLVSNTLGNVDHYKAAASKTGGTAIAVVQNAGMKSGENPKKDEKDEKDKDKPKGGSEAKSDSQNANNTGQQTPTPDQGGRGANTINTFERQPEGSRPRTPVA
jgi:hypothetical protein